VPEDGNRKAHSGERPRTRSADVQLPVLSDAQVQANGKSYRSYSYSQSQRRRTRNSEKPSQEPGSPREASQARRAIKTLAGVRLGWLEVMMKNATMKIMPGTRISISTPLQLRLRPHAVRNPES